MNNRYLGFMLGAAIVVLAACSVTPTAPQATSKVAKRAHYENGEFCRSGYVVGSGRDANGNPTDSTYTGCTDDQ